jgi:hypothetical protein
MTSWLGTRGNLGYLGAHALLLGGGSGLLFLQRYLWLLKIAEQGYGPYQTAGSLLEVCAVFVIIDLIVLSWALRGSRTEKNISLLWPALFLGSALFILLANAA